MTIRIGITGHRKLSNTEEIRNDIRFSLLYFKEKYKYEKLIVVSSLAVGADTIFGEEALNLDIPLEIIFPFALSEYKKDFTNRQWRSLKKLIADNEYFIAKSEIPANAVERNEAYFVTGKMISDKSDIMIAVWDKQPAKGKGGTGDIVDYARSKSKELHIINTAQIEEFKKTDKEAEKYKYLFKLFWQLGIGSALIAAFILTYKASIGIANHQLEVISGIVEIILLVISYPLLVLLASRQKKIQLDKRRETETLRTSETYKDAEIPVVNKFYQKNPDKEVDDYYSIEGNAIRGIDKIQKENFENAKRTIYCLAFGQLKYHEIYRIKKFRKLDNRYHIILKVITILFFTAAILHFIIEVSDQKMLNWLSEKQIKIISSITMFLTLFFPPFYASVEGIRFFNDWRAYIRSSYDIVEKLNSILSKTMKCNYEDGKLIEIAQELRELLNRENLYWADKIDKSEIQIKP